MPTYRSLSQHLCLLTSPSDHQAHPITKPTHTARVRTTHLRGGFFLSLSLLFSTPMPHTPSIIAHHTLHVVFLVLFFLL
jgi:hypothetical protein